MHIFSRKSMGKRSFLRTIFFALRVSLHWKSTFSHRPGRNYICPRVFEYINLYRITTYKRTYKRTWAHTPNMKQTLWCSECPYNAPWRKSNHPYMYHIVYIVDFTTMTSSFINVLQRSLNVSGSLWAAWVGSVSEIVNSKFHRSFYHPQPQCTFACQIVFMK